MYLETVNKIFDDVFNGKPTEIIRNTVGLAGYVYTVVFNDTKYVIKISDDKNLILGSTYWLNKVKDLDIPTPCVIAENLVNAPYYFVMSFIPGNDLGLVYSSLLKSEKIIIAKKIIGFQKEIKKLPMAKGFGSLNSYEDSENICSSWEESLLNDINRAEEAIINNGIFSVEYVMKLKKIMPNFKEYFSSVKPEPFLDDITTKNVLIHEGKLSGIIDLDWISFGDDVLFLGLVTMALLSMKADLDYAVYLKDEMNLNDMQERALKFYVLMFCVIFMSEKGMCFNQAEPMKVSEEEKMLLQEIFNRYYEELEL
ncbi:MAG: phosphotransferase [Treponema sp.]|nr:phosphotransferase [Treponema sp.]